MADEWTWNTTRHEETVKRAHSQKPTSRFAERTSGTCVLFVFGKQDLICTVVVFMSAFLPREVKLRRNRQR